jgi:hypothetical protein
MNAKSRITTFLPKLSSVRAIFAAVLLVAVATSVPANAAGSARSSEAAKTAPQAKVDRSTSASLLVTVYDGTRQLMPAGTTVYIQVFNGSQKKVASGFYKGPAVQFNGLPIHNNLDDNYRVVASAKGYNTYGVAAVPVHAGQTAKAEILLIPKHGQLDFDDWSTLRQDYPWLADLLANGTASESDAKARYEQLMQEDPGALAAILNITTAGHQIGLDNGLFISYFKQIVWDEQRPEWRNHKMVGFNPFDDTLHVMRHDRFWAYADKRLVDQVEAGVQEGRFFVEHGAQVFHPGATGSFKENTMEEGHIHVSFYGNTTKVIDGVECVLLEIHIDLYKDLLAHGILEVIPNTLTGHLTEPEDAYQHRWIASINSGQGEFAPPLTIVPYTGKDWHRHKIQVGTQKD